MMPPNERPAADAGCCVLFAFGHLRPRAAQAERYHDVNHAAGEYLPAADEARPQRERSADQAKAEIAEADEVFLRDANTQRL